MIGIDIVSIKRIKKLIKNHQTAINKILHKNEIKILNTKNNKIDYFSFIAGRWAIKEAIFKCNNNYAIFNQLNISYENKKPILIVNNQKININISISHEKKYAIAVAYSI